VMKSGNRFTSNTIGDWAAIGLIFTARCNAERVIATTSRLSVRTSVCQSVTLRYRNHIGWNSSKIISWLGFSLSADYITSTPREQHLETLAGLRVGYGKSGFRRIKAL